jgi:phenylpropionate dioxygenase-like ring-hydroxylating dioxygenase large terminal subunit
MEHQQSALYEAVSQQVARTTYPEGFPALPEVPSGRYFDRGFYDLEMKHLWHKTWLHVGHISLLPKAGSYILFERLGLSIIISRGLEGDVKAFHNVCRHRASALLLEKQGTARRFVCPYHAWGYDLDGKLTSVPDAHDFACLNKAERGLLPVRCEQMRGMLYINLDQDAGALADFIAPIERQIGSFPLERMECKGIVEMESACNWKVAYDNFLEIYHVNSVHPKSLAPFLDSKSFTISLLKNGHSRFATRKKGGESLLGKQLDAPDTTDDVFKDHTMALPMFPNSFTALDPAVFVWQNWWPIDERTHVMTAYIMGWKKDEGDTDEEKAFWEGMKGRTLEIVAEDNRLFADLQRGLESDLMPNILMGYQERALYWYQEEIDRRIGRENVPADLRIEPVLADFISHD